MTATIRLLLAVLSLLSVSAFSPPQPALGSMMQRSSLKMATDTEEAYCAPEEGEFCLTDSKTGKMVRLTQEEKERIFLDALQSYYATGRQVMVDEEFDLLKEDLQWSGSEVISLNREEAKYLAAMEAFNKGEPTLDDKEFDDLKTSLKEAGSKFAVSRQPKCLIDTGVCTVVMQEDRFRSNLLYVPALTILTSIWLGPAFEIVANFVVRLNPLFFLLIAAYPIFVIAKFITDDLVFTNKKVATGPCPSCEFENRIYFGNILGVEGFTDQATVKCPNCKEQFTVQRNTLRAVTLPK